MGAPRVHREKPGRGPSAIDKALDVRSPGAPLRLLGFGLFPMRIGARR